MNSLVAKASAYWDSIPVPVRSIINVVVGAGVAASADYVLSATGHGFNMASLWGAFSTAAGTALWRAVNPTDPGYGFGKGTATVPADPSTVVDSGAPFDPSAGGSA